MANDENVSMRFIEDAEGVAIGGHRAQDIRRRMRTIFNHNMEDRPQHGLAMQISSSDTTIRRW